MKAIVYRDYGSADVLRYEEIEKPVAGADEVLIKVGAASVNPLDWKVMSGGPFIVRLLPGLGKPKIKRSGVDVAGTIESVGMNVTQFKQGDEVFGTCHGAFAEYATSRSVTGMKSALVRKPEKLTFEQAASIPVAGLTALQGLRDHGRIQAGQSVLINGAAGGVGTFAVQIAKVFGAKVTGVCSTRNVDMVRSIGADRVIDYTQEDFTTRSERYDLLLDCVGNRSLSACRRILKPTGRLVLVGAPKDISMIALVGRLIAVLALSPLLRQKMSFFIAKGKKADLTMLGDLMAAGKTKAVIDRRYLLREAAEAFRYMEEGHARGKVVITVEDRDEA